MQVLPSNSLFQEVDLPGKCSGVVVSENQIVILDVSGCPSLSKKYWDISKIPEILQQIEKTKKVKKKSGPIWGRKNIDDDEKTSEKGVGEKQGDLGGWLSDDINNGGKSGGNNVDVDGTYV